MNFIGHDHGCMKTGTWSLIHHATDPSPFCPTWTVLDQNDMDGIGSPQTCPLKPVLSTQRTCVCSHTRGTHAHMYRHSTVHVQLAVPWSRMRIKSCWFLFRCSTIPLFRIACFITSQFVSLDSHPLSHCLVFLALFSSSLLVYTLSPSDSLFNLSWALILKSANVASHPLFYCLIFLGLLSSSLLIYIPSHLLFHHLTFADFLVYAVLISFV